LGALQHLLSNFSRYLCKRTNTRTTSKDTTQTFFCKTLNTFTLACSKRFGGSGAKNFTDNGATQRDKGSGSFKRSAGYGSSYSTFTGNRCTFFGLTLKTRTKQLKNGRSGSSTHTTNQRPQRAKRSTCHSAKPSRRKCRTDVRKLFCYGTGNLADNFACCGQ
jgi:hypothetical protein